jgi:hypothetical protein
LDQNNSQNNNQNNKSPRPIGEGMIKLAAVMIGAAIVACCYSYTKVDEVIVRILILAMSLITIGVAVLMISAVIFARRADKSRNNFFLYDRKTKKEISVGELTFKEMRVRLLGFMSVFRHKGKIYIGDLLADGKTVPEQFKPLFCYELLYELATDDGLDAEMFLSFGPECADIFSRYLRQNQDYELALRLRSFIFDFAEGNKRVEEFREYMRGLGTHIEEKMMQYTKDNIEKFR